MKTPDIHREHMTTMNVRHADHATDQATRPR